MALRLLVDYGEGDEYQDDGDTISSTSSISGRNGETAELVYSEQVRIDAEIGFTGSISGENSTEDHFSESSPKQLYGYPHCLELTEDEKVAIPEDTLLPLPIDLEKKYLELLVTQQQKNLDVNEEIQKSKAFRNPSIYQKLIEYCQIEEFGSNFPHDQFDPTRWTESSSVEELARLQAVATEKHEKEKKSGKSQDSVVKRQTKWDSDPATTKRTAFSTSISSKKSSGNLSKSTK